MHKVIHLVLADIFSLLTLHITKVSKGIRIQKQSIERLFWITLKPAVNFIFIVS